ncbi:MAG: pyridoxamine 5'-phosphate oxidase family protein [Defluviitaleaceae bacterium]|nr:pyridoxamine 5'-phosphate oxidase family protein [Defluviitaleaceae bacterium]
MRRSDREITDKNEIFDVLRRADTVRLGINGEPYPYVVPLSFGLEERDGQIIIYVHGAKEGLKHELIKKDSHVCIEADIFYRYAETNPGFTTVYESVIGFGAAEEALGEEAVRGCELLLEHCGFGGCGFDRAGLMHTRVYKIVLHSVTGKRRFL